MKPKDEIIVNAIKSGQNENAIRALYDTSFKKIKDFIKKNSGSTEDAEDIFQDAVIAFYKMVKEGRFDERFDIDAFLYTAARNAWINKAKRDQRVTPMPDHFHVASDQHIHKALASRERNEQVALVFDQIGQKCKELLTLVVYFDYSMKEVCEKMGFPNENAAKTQHYKCKQKLIELVGKNSSFKQMLQNVE